MTLKFTAIKRKEEYSPNHITNDALILARTAEELKKLGVDCNIIDESDIETEFNFNGRLIFSMAQGPAAVNKLAKLEAEGAFVINSSKSVFNCYRVNMVDLLQNARVNFPFSKKVKTSDTNLNYSLSSFKSRKIWVKRGDVHAIHREDVSPVYSDEELLNLLKEFSNRGIEYAILQKHLDGDTIKFYCVRGTSFFYWYYLNGINHTKFDLDKLKKYADVSAEKLELTIYGGDAIVSAEGEISIIDINDWPSFAPIRDEASKIIANTIYKKAINYSNLITHEGKTYVNYSR